MNESCYSEWKIPKSEIRHEAAVEEDRNGIINS